MSENQPMTNMTTECAECRHKFLRYASHCPECGWVRPRRKKVNKVMIASLIGSAFALWMTFVLSAKFNQETGAPSRHSQPSGVGR